MESEREVIHLFLQSKNRIVNDDAYLHFLEKPEESSLKGIIKDCELINIQLEGYSIDELKMIKASIRGSVESLKFMQLMVPAIAFALGLMGTNLLASKGGLTSVIAGIIAIGVVGGIMYISILQRRRIGAAVFIEELINSYIAKNENNNS